MTTCDTLTLPGFEPMESDASTPSAAASHARISRWLAEVRVSTESEADSGESTPVWLASFDRSSSSWRTSGLCGLEDLPLFSETLPRSGMTRSGTLYLLPPLVRLIYASGSGSSPSGPSLRIGSKTMPLMQLPTPTAQDSEQSGGKGATSRKTRGMSLHRWGADHSHSLIPTPTSGDANASGSRNTATSKAHPGLSLTDWARGDGGTGRLLPSPGASDNRNAADYSDGSRDHSPQLRHLGRGLLNPRFVEWMMGLPSGWTALP